MVVVLLCRVGGEGVNREIGEKGGKGAQAERTMADMTRSTRPKDTHRFVQQRFRALC